MVGSMTSALFVGVTGPAVAAVAAERSSLSSYARYLLPGSFMVTKESCMRYYRRDSANCRKLPPIPHIRRACWAAAGLKLGACMARAVA
jgi:hypothetical protein